METTGDGAAALAEARATESEHPSPDGLPILWHLKASPYNEKVRWALDYKDLPHVRRAVDPPAHVKIAKRLAGGRTFPVLEFDGGAIGDSTDIIEELERRCPEPRLYPQDCAECERAVELEEFFDEEVIPPFRRLVLHHALPDPDLLFGMFAQDLPRARRVTARAMYPAVTRRIAALFDVTDETVATSWERARAAAERFATEVQPSGYLACDRFTIADLAGAASFAPIVAPPGFPYPQPQRDHPRFAPLREILDECGASEWTREMYTRHRGSSCEVVV